MFWPKLLRASLLLLLLFSPLPASACDTPTALAIDMTTPYNSHGGLGSVVESQAALWAQGNKDPKGTEAGGVSVTLLPQDAGKVS
jgi:hypothetical protein